MDATDKQLDGYVQYTHPKSTEEVMPQQKRPIGERFWEKVDKTPGYGPNGDCWQWTSHLEKDGYGQFWVGGKKRNERSNRLAWVLVHGEIPNGLHVLHRCDNSSCCRPDHLFLGTSEDNLQDMIRKRRGKGNCFQPILSESQAVELINRYRNRHLTGETMRQIAASYGVTRNYIYRLNNGDTRPSLQRMASKNTQPKR